MTIDFKDLFSTFSPFHTRMDVSMNFRNLRDYAVLTDEKGNQLPNTIQRILNYPRVFCDAVVAELQQDTETWDITNVDATVQHKLEELFKLWMYNNDRMLKRQMIEPFDDCQDFLIPVRGPGAALPLVQYDPDRKVYLITFTPQDTRWMEWRVGSYGMELATNGIRVNKEAIAKKYDKPLSFFKTTTKEIELKVCWTPQEYALHELLNGEVSGDPVFVKPNPLGFVPVCVASTPLSPEVISTPNGYAQDLKEWSPDIFAPILNQLKYLNESASIDATLNWEQFSTPLALMNKSGVGTDPMTVDMKELVLAGYNIRVPLPPGTELVPIPVKDMAASTERLFQLYFQGFEMGAFSSASWGEAGNREPALVYAERKSTTGKVVNPRRKCKVSLYQQMFDNISRQIREKKFWITDIPKEETYAITEIPMDLFVKNFTINIGFSSISPQENLVNGQFAAQLHRDLGIELVDVFRDIMHDPDPEGKARAAIKGKLKAMSISVTFAEGGLAFCPDKDATQEEIEELLADVSLMDFKKWFESQENPINQPPNPASQPKQGNGAATPNSNKLASMQEQRTGQRAMRNASNSRTGGA
jgi:hypothetical protein